MEDHFLTYRQASELVGKSVDVLRRLVYQGRLHTFKGDDKRSKRLSSNELRGFFGLMTVETKEENQQTTTNPEALPGAERDTNALLQSMHDAIIAMSGDIRRLANNLERNTPAAPTTPETQPAPTTPETQPAPTTPDAPTVTVTTPETPAEPKYRYIRRNGRRVKRLIKE